MIVDRRLCRGDVPRSAANSARRAPVITASRSARPAARVERARRAIAEQTASAAIDLRFDGVGTLAIDRPMSGEVAGEIHSMRRPDIARAITSCWISLVPSKIVWILASRCQRSTGYSRV